MKFRGFLLVLSMLCGAPVYGMNLPSEPLQVVNIAQQIIPQITSKNDLGDFVGSLGTVCVQENLISKSSNCKFLVEIVLGGVLGMVQLPLMAYNAQSVEVYRGTFLHVPAQLVQVILNAQRGDPKTQLLTKPACEKLAVVVNALVERALVEAPELLAKPDSYGMPPLYTAIFLLWQLDAIYGTLFSQLPQLHTELKKLVKKYIEGVYDPSVRNTPSTKLGVTGSTLTEPNNFYELAEVEKLSGAGLANSVVTPLAFARALGLLDIVALFEQCEKLETALGNFSRSLSGLAKTLNP